MDTDNRPTDNREEIDRRLRIMETVENELELQKGEAIFSLTIFLCSMSVWILLVALWERLGRPIPPKLLTFGVELIAAVMLAVILKFTRLSIRKMGVTKQNLKSALRRAVVISTVIAAGMIALKLITRPGEPLIDWSKFDPFYPLTSVLQEFLARGFLLTTLKQINTSKNGHHIAVICSSLMFTSLHLYYGFLYMLGAGLLSVILGYCYLKDKNIWGVSLIHFVFGTLGVMLELV